MLFSDPLTNKAQYEKFMDYYSKLYLRNASDIPSFMSTIFHCDDLDAENVPRIKEEKSKQPAFINEMPTEILLNIFSQAIPSTTIDPFKATAGPWVLSKVCKKWNSIITTYAPLWTNITIDTSPKAMNVLKPYRCLLDVLKHSQDQPLSIRFVEGENTMLSVTHILLRILMKHAPRWKNLDFTLSNPETLAVLDAVRGRLGSLESLTFSGSPGMIADMPWSVTPCSIFADTPQLKSANVSMGGFTLELPFAQLKSFSDHWCGARAKEMSIPEGISKYLQEMGQVEEYKLYGPELKNVTPMINNIRLPFLRTLHAGDPRVLRSIIAPRLEEVHVQLFNKDFREVNLPVLLFLIERSRCSLRKITFGDCMPVVNKFISILRASPALEELVLSFTVWNDRMDSCLLEILPSIHVKGGGEGEGDRETPLVPRLTKLNVIVQHKHKSRTVPSMSFLRDTLIDVVENRRNHKMTGVAKLASVEVRAAVLVKQDIAVSPGAGNVERWNRLKDGGMGALFHVIGGKADEECPPINSRMIRVDPDPRSPAYLQREYV
ncbi:uncharacterized protein EV420DRAFT_986508 [Desarmillaria tabescens]|uniref:F-box domain-containing protein n=1 Tax=Armillaria tabescens TaxID=1929756 RepID=A0AA39JLD4_ARMTA|nr:uncharacterized protein EV420DRAFT_986508 [Desarmillaria tabescens]KAK0444895.1 hypothetical protein EV420DRAFT_986508 [Desarmillaria tabescens]